jgi:acyl-CoA thioester hydrolase
MEDQQLYSRKYDVKWADMDPNGHLRHTVYGDYAVDVRFRFLIEHEFPPARFQEMGFGPVILSEENHYFREVLLGETITVTVKLAGLAPDGSRWRMLHEVIKPNGKLSATLRVEGGWLDLRRRKLVAPPPALLELIDDLARSDDFADLPSLSSPASA